MGGSRDLDLHLGDLVDGLALEPGDRLGHQLAVEVVAHCGDVSGLPGADQVAGAPNLEVPHRDAKSRAELGRLAHGLEPFVGLLGQDLVPRVEQVGIGPLARPADAATQLVELAEAEQVGAVDDEGVDRRHVDARLDDGGADQHVVLALPEVVDDLLE